MTTEEDARRIQMVREQSRRLVTIGACATSGGIQALRNFADVDDFMSVVYASPEYVSTLATSTPISDHVHVDFELQGCPINKRQLLEVISAFLNERRPAISSASVCMECKRRGNVCVMVAHGTPCLGSGHPRGLRRPLPVVRPRLLRLLRADGDAQHRLALRLARATWARTRSTSSASTARSTRTRGPSGRRARRMSAEPAHARAPSGPTCWRAWRARGRCTCASATAEVDEVQLRIYEPPRFFEALLRGRALHRAARHHRAHLRHLPHRLPDERLRGDRGRLRRGRRRADPRCCAA